jgi:hypothetical protein
MDRVVVVHSWIGLSIRCLDFKRQLLEDFWINPELLSEIELLEYILQHKV